MFNSVRARMTVWYVGLLALLLVTIGAGPFLLVRKELYEKTDLLLKSVSRAALSLTQVELQKGLGDGQAASNALESMSSLDYSSYSIAIFDGQGYLLALKPQGNSRNISFPSGSLQTDGAAHMYTSNVEGGERELRRFTARRVKLEPPGRIYTIVVSRPLAPVLEDLDTDQRILLLAVPTGLLLAGIGGWFLIRKNLAPALAMSEQAHQIGAENLDQRLAVVNPHDELGQLASTFNGLLSRLSSAFSLQRQFMADASHELRTPVSVVRTTTSVTLEKERRSEEEYRSALVIIDEQARRLTRIVDDMFRLARADAGHLSVQMCPFYLDELVDETARAARVLGAPKEITVKTSHLKESLCYGDENLLRQMLSNLLDNAVKFNRRGGSVTLDLERKNGLYRISVSDTGPGIPLEAQARIFERFFRLEKTGASSDGTASSGTGAGLGLSIAEWVAHAHGGSLLLERSESNGSTFVAFVPIGAPGMEDLDFTS